FDATDIYREMQKDLARIFPFTVITETRMMPALLLEVDDPVLFEKIKQESGGRPQTLYKNGTTSYLNQTLAEVIVRPIAAKYMIDGISCVNNTGYDGPISLVSKLNLYDPESMAVILKGMGLKLVKGTHPVKVMTIKKAGNKN